MFRSLFKKKAKTAVKPPITKPENTAEIQEKKPPKLSKLSEEQIAKAIQEALGK